MMQEENQIVDQAERVMKTLSEARDDMGKKIGMVTTSQIRKFLTAVNTVTEKVNMYKLENEKTKDSLPIELQAQIKYLKVKLAYQIGRNNNRGKNPVKDFAEKAKLMEWIDEIKDSVKAYENFAHYVEALVAYHKFYGGKDK